MAIQHGSNSELTFFDRVYILAREIPAGSVTTYGAIARMLGNPRAARTVGWALSSLPHGSDVPWHRVINSQGTISNRSGGSGAERQRRLLEDEGIVFDATGRVDMDRFEWAGLPWPETEILFQR
jgi:methylated-DNA-protein-cysteine methyltransferase-like protein